MSVEPNLTVEGADLLLKNLLLETRPVYRRALLEVFGHDHKLIISHPSGQHLVGLRLGDLDEESAKDVLWLSVEFKRLTNANDEPGVSQLAAALPFILSALLLVDRYNSDHLSFFGIVLDNDDALSEIVHFLKSMPDAQRKVTASAMRAALICYAHYSMGEGLEDQCALTRAGDNIIDLLYFTSPH